MAKAIIFDFDGTLVDSEPLYDRQFKKILREEKVEIDSKDFSAFHGKGIENTVKYWKKEYPGKADWDGIGKKFLACFGEIAVIAPLFPGVLELLETLSQNYSMPVALCSNSPREVVLRGLRARKIEGFFPEKVVVCREDFNTPKPAPDAYLKACSKLGFPPEECVAIEDSLAGTASAKSAGCKVILFNSNGYSKEILASAGADFVATSWKQITPEVLRKI